MRCAIAAIGILVLSAPWLTLATGCSSTSAERVKADKFMELASRPDTSETSIRVIGTTHTRAYLEAWAGFYSLSLEHATIYWAPLSELPPDTIAELKAGQNPWRWGSGSHWWEWYQGRWLK